MNVLKPICYTQYNTANSVSVVVTKCHRQMDEFNDKNVNVVILLSHSEIGKIGLELVQAICNNFFYLILKL